VSKILDNTAAIKSAKDELDGCKGFINSSKVSVVIQLLVSLICSAE
jgi:hypothetical protein